MPGLCKRIACMALCCILLPLCTACNGITGSVTEEKDTVSSAVGNITPADKAPVSSVEIDPDTSGNSYDYNTIDGVTVPPRNFYTPVSITFGFDALQTEAQRYFYERLASDVYIVAQQPAAGGSYLVDKIYLPGMQLKEAEIRLVIEAFSNDHPEVFWLDNLFGYSYNATEMIIQMYSLLSPQAIGAYTKEIENAVDTIISSVPKGLGEYERQLFIHDTFLKTCVYAANIKTMQQDWKPFTLYGALQEGKAVCEGYTKAMQYLLSFVGIESIPVNGTVKNEWHQWNLVKIDGCWYHMDATWNDSTDYIFYDYFNVTDKIIQYDHTLATSFFSLSADEICGTSGKEAHLFNISVPACTETAANFYIHEAAILYGFDEKATKTVETKMLQTALQKKGEFYIQISNSLDYKQAVEQLFYQSPYQFFTYIDDTNRLLDGAYTIDKENVGILKKEHLRIIEVRLQYA